MTRSFLPMPRISEAPAPANVLDFLEPLARAGSVPAFAGAAIDASRLIAGARRRFSDVAAGSGAETVRVTDPPSSVPELAAALQRLGPEHPARSRLHGSGDGAPVAISRLVTEQEFRATALYQELHRWMSVTDELVIPVPHHVHPACVAIGRTTWGFTDDELRLAGELQRMLTVTYAGMREREIMRAGAPMAERLARSHGRELLISHPDGDLRRLDGTRVVLDEALTAAVCHATRLAARVVAGVELGSPLVEVSSASADGEQYTLRVHAPDTDGELLPITLERSRTAVTVAELARHGLTARQGQVMSLVLNGATNGGVANALGISERTVEKHVLAAYDKLGVRTRTKALLAVLD